MTVPNASDVLLIVALATGVALVAATLGLLALRLGRRRSLTGQLLILVLAVVVSVVGGTLAVAQAMFLSTHDLVVTLWVALVSGLVSLPVALLLGRSLMRTAQQLLESARAVGSGAVVAAGEHRSTELNALAAELSATSERLADARRQMELMEAARRDLVAWVSHDLRTPLASIRAMAEALEDGLVDDPARYHRRLRVQVDRISTLVDDLFELSRLHAGHLRLQRSPVAVYDLVSDVVADVAPSIAARQVDVRAHGDLDETLEVDPRQLVRALENLLTNALRFSPVGSAVDIEVRSGRTEVEISVRDRGAGIHPDDMAHVFDAGWRADPGRTSDENGSGSGAGLGLAIVKGIVEAHGGAVEVYDVQPGSRFVLVLPRRAPAAHEATVTER